MLYVYTPSYRGPLGFEGDAKGPRASNASPPRQEPPPPPPAPAPIGVDPAELNRLRLQASEVVNAVRPILSPLPNIPVVSPVPLSGKVALREPQNSNCLRGGPPQNSDCFRAKREPPGGEGEGLQASEVRFQRAPLQKPTVGVCLGP